MSIIDIIEKYVLPELTLSDNDLARILPKNAPIQVEELIAFSDPLLDLLEEKNQKPAILAAEEMKEAPPQEGDIALKQGSSKPLFIEHDSALFDAASFNDTDKIKSLLESGYDVNQEDKLRSSRPFHIAAFMGSNQALKLLIDAGSDLKDKAMGGYNALDLALRSNHFETASILVATDQFDVHAKSPDGKAPLLRLYEALEAEISAAVPTQLDNIIDAMREMVQHTDFCYILDEGSYIPLAMKIKALMSYAHTNEIYDQLNDLLNTIEHQDPSVNKFVAALDLFHQFPTDQSYDFKLPNGKTITFEPEGHLPQYTTQLAYDSLTAFLDQMTPENSTQAERDVFRTLQEIYRDAVDFKQKMMQDHIIHEALELYNQGETILLPSGWEGHFINIILNKEMGLYVTANSGDRYTGESSTDLESSPESVKPVEPAGLLFYQMQDGSKIDFEFIQTTLSNSDRLTLEYNHQHAYGLNKRVYEIELNDQAFNNCGWESHRNAIQGLLFMELMHGGMAQDDAKDLASTCFKKWDNFHGSFVIDRYIAQGGGLSDEAIAHILETIMDEPNHEDHCEKLASLLPTESPQAENVEALPGQPVESLEHHAPIPHFVNVAHEVVVPEVLA